MDDAHNDIRIKSARIFACIFEYMVKYAIDDRFTSDKHLSIHMFQSFMIHMDDQDLNVQVICLFEPIEYQLYLFTHTTKTCFYVS